MRPISLMIVATASPAHAGLAGAHPITHSNDDAQLKGGVQDFARNPSADLYRTHQPLLSIVKRYANANAHDKGDTTSSVDVAQCRKDALAEGLSDSSIAIRVLRARQVATRCSQTTSFTKSTCHR